jgi:hypothetical protein
MAGSPALPQRRGRLHSPVTVSLARGRQELPTTLLNTAEPLVALALLTGPLAALALLTRLRYGTTDRPVPPATPVYMAEPAQGEVRNSTLALRLMSNSASQLRGMIGHPLGPAVHYTTRLPGLKRRT